MIRQLHIEGFRCFRELRVEPLNRVNLFVGQNNAGKTSLLEAVEVVAIGHVEGLALSAVRRDENILRPSGFSEDFKEHVLDPSHLFFGHDLGRGQFTRRQDGYVRSSYAAGNQFGPESIEKISQLTR